MRVITENCCAASKATPALHSMHMHALSSHIMTAARRGLGKLPYGERQQSAFTPLEHVMLKPAVNQDNSLVQAGATALCTQGSAVSIDPCNHNTFSLTSLSTLQAAQLWYQLPGCAGYLDTQTVSLRPRTVHGLQACRWSPARGSGQTLLPASLCSFICLMLLGLLLLSYIWLLLLQAAALTMPPSLCCCHLCSKPARVYRHNLIAPSRLRPVLSGR